MIHSPRLARITALGLLLSLLLPAAAFAQEQPADTFTIRIVHTNDIHARVEENAEDGMIGMARLAGVIDRYTADADLDLVLDSGDLFHGQPVATLVQGESIAALVRACGYDAVTAGNHDWSYGADQLKALCSLADVAMLAGNVTQASTGQPFFDQTFYTESVQIGGQELKVGLFGVFDPSLKGDTAPRNIAGLSFGNAAAYANAAAAALRAQGCDIVIGLTHAADPAALAAATGGVDLWLAGHEHVRLDQWVSDADGKDARVVESGYYLYSLSLIELSGTLGADGAVGDLRIDVMPADYAAVSDDTPSPAVAAVLDGIHAAQQDKLSEKVGETPAALDGVWEDLRIDQQNLGNVVADAYLLETGADVAFENAGGIRASIEAGVVTYGDIIGVSPYGNYIVTKQVTGAQLIDMLETSLDICLQSRAANDSGIYDAWPDNSGSYLQFGGMTVTWDPEAAKGSRVISIEMEGRTFREDDTYTVATNNFVAISEDYPPLAQADEVGQYSACDEALARFFQTQSADAIAASVYDERLLAQPGGALRPSAAFSDVQSTDWFCDAVDYMVAHGVMNGTSTTTFSPDETLTRGMGATLLWRLADSPAADPAPFDDVASGAYYAGAIGWAADTQVVTGYDQTHFGPDDAVTREQFTALLYRFAQQQGQDVSVGEDTNLLSYTDAAAVSGYAVPAMQWACGTGVILGDSGRLAPQDAVTRAEAAQMLMRYLAPAA